MDGERRRHEWRASQTRQSLLRDQPKKNQENKNQMKTNEFISGLRAAPGNQLIFVDLAGHAVHGGYHLTELKAASFETVDCGGQKKPRAGNNREILGAGRPGDEKNKTPK